MKVEYIEALTTFALILTYLLTDSRLAIVALFGLIIITFGIQAGGNPFVAIPKVLLGRADLGHFRTLFTAQLVGMIVALFSYYALVKSGLIAKHSLDKI